MKIPTLTVKLDLAPPKMRRMMRGYSGSRHMLDGSAVSAVRFLAWPYPNSTRLVSGTGTSGSHNQGAYNIYYTQLEGNAPVFEADDIKYYVDRSIPRYIEFKSSYNKSDPGQAPKGRLGVSMEIASPPKKQLVRPKKPSYNPPRLKRFGKPSVRDWTSEDPAPESFVEARKRDLKLLDAWFVKFEASKEALKSYDALYIKRMAKYELLLAKHLELVDKALRPRYKATSTRVVSTVRPDNEFKLLKLVPDPESDARLTELGFCGGDDIKPFERDSYGYPIWSATHPRFRWDFENERPGVNVFGGYPTIGSLLLPPQLQSFDRGNLFIGTCSMWDDFWGIPSWQSTRDGKLYDALHSDLVSMGNSLVDDVEAKLTRKVYSKLKNNVVHVGNLIGERKQTFDLMLSLYKRISSLILLKKGTLKAVGAFVTNKKAWADDVLAFKFGVEPLVLDFLALSEHLGKLPPDMPIITVRTNNSQFPKRVSVRRNGVRFDGSIEISYVFKLTSTMEVWESMKNYGLTNPMETAWELTPWSFVVDWFLPLGEYLNSLTADSGLNYKTGTRKIKMTGTWTIGGTSGYDPQNPDFSRSEGKWLSGKFSGQLIHRTVLSELPDRRKIATFKNPWSLSHGIEAIALAVQRMK